MKPCGVVVVEDPVRGLGRLRLTEITALAHVANRPIVHHVVDALLSSGIEEIVVVCSRELTADVRACLGTRTNGAGVSIRYVAGAAPLHLPDAMTLAAPLVGDEPCVVHVAGGLLEKPLQPLVAQLRGDAPDALLLVYQAEAPDGHLNALTREMLHVAEFNPECGALGIAGVLLFGPGALKHVAGSNWWTKREADLTVIAQRVRAAGGRLNVQMAEAWCRYQGNASDLLELNRIILDRLENPDRRRDTNGNRIEGRVEIHDAASVHTSVIIGPAIIGAGARIADAYIGPYTAIGAGALIDGAEIERSIISAGATIRYVGCRLAGSVIGRDARVVREFSPPRALRLRVGADTEVVFS